MEFHIQLILCSNLLERDWVDLLGALFFLGIVFENSFLFQGFNPAYSRKHHESKIKLKTKTQNNSIVHLMEFISH